MLNKEKIYPYLQDLENRLNVSQETALWENWKSFANLKAPKNGPFSPMKRTPSAPSLPWPNIPINDALEDENLMLLREFKSVSDHLAMGDGSILQVRANYGVGILPSLFGAERFIMPYEMDCLPNVRPLSGHKEQIQKIIDSPEMDITGGYSQNVFTFAHNLLQIFKDFPKIAAFVFPEHPDCQGPMDVCELLWGSELFLDLYDEPEMVHAFLQVISDTYIRFLARWLELFPPIQYHPWFGRLHRGNICIRNDSAMNLSPDFYREFILPYDSKIMNVFQGGAIHFCGKGDHFISILSETPFLFSVDVSQPHLNNMDIILAHTIDKNITLTCCQGDYLNSIDLTKHQYHNLAI